MRLALNQAYHGEGHTRPNPPVGALLVRHGEILARGTHHQAGAPHAEIVALEACSTKPDGATLYVTLEPCSSHGRTPPCTTRIVAAGIRRVVAGCADPNPKHAGRGFTLLREAGVEVTHGVLEDTCRRLIAPFAKRLVQGLPWVTLKLAMTLDGRIADRHGSAKWITGTRSRNWVQQLRRRADAILVGSGTALADDPELRCRLRNAGTAWRIVVDGAGRLHAGLRLLHDEWNHHTLIATTRKGADILARQLPPENQVTLWPLPEATPGERMPLRPLLQKLAREKDVMHLVCEGGGQVAGSLVREGLVDEFALFYGPLLLGDARALPAMSGLDRSLHESLKLKIRQVKRSGEDLLVLAEPETRG